MIEVFVTDGSAADEERMGKTLFSITSEKPDKNKAKKEVFQNLEEAKPFLDESLNKGKTVWIPTQSEGAKHGEAEKERD